MRSSKDENGQVTSYCYFTGGCGESGLDPLGRLTEVDYPDGGVTSASYQDTGTISATTTVKSSGPSIVKMVFFDGMGRPKQIVGQSVDDPGFPVFSSPTSQDAAADRQ